MAEKQPSKESEGWRLSELSDRQLEFAVQAGAALSREFDIDPSDLKVKQSDDGSRIFISYKGEDVKVTSKLASTETIKVGSFGRYNVDGHGESDTPIVPIPKSF